MRENVCERIRKRGSGGRIRNRGRKTSFLCVIVNDEILRPVLQQDSARQ